MGDELRIIVKGDFSQLESNLRKFSNKTINVKATTSGKKEVDDLGKSTDKLGSSAVGAVSKFAQWYVIGKIVSEVGKGIAGMVSNVAELDASMTTMSFTFDATREQLEGMVTASEDFARQLGSTTSEVMEAVKIYTNLNATMDEILSKSQAAVVLSNLGGSAIGIEQAADSIQSLSSQFKLADDEGLKIADTFTYISGNLAMDFSKGITEMSAAVKASGSIASEAGFTYEQFLSVIGKTMEFSRQSGAQVSNAMKTIFSRIQRVSDLSEGEISKIEGAYQKIGISIRSSEGTFQNMSDTIGQLSTKWSTLTDVEKSYIAELSAGVRQKSIFLSMMETYTGAMSLATEATYSNGYAMEQNEKFVQSLQGRIQAFQQSYQELSRSMVDSDFLKTIVDSGTDVMTFLKDVENGFGVVNTALLILIPTWVLLNKQMLLTKASGIITFISELSVMYHALGAGMTAAAVAGGVLNLVLLGVGALVVGVTAGIMAYSVAQAKLTREIEESANNLKLLGEQTESIDKLIYKLEYLGEKADKTDAEIRDFEATQKSLQSILPDSSYLIDEQNQSLEEQIDVYKRLSELKYEDKIKEAQAIFAKSAPMYDKAKDNVAEYTRQLKIADDHIGGLIKKKTEEGELTKIEERQLKSSVEWREDLNEKLKDNKSLVDSYNTSLDILNETEGDHADVVKQSVDEIIVAYDAEMKALDLTVASSDEEKKSKINNQIELTRTVISEVKARINAYMLEIKALNEAQKIVESLASNNSSVMFMGADKILADKKKPIENEVEKLNDLISGWNKSIAGMHTNYKAVGGYSGGDSDGKSSSKDKTKEAEKYLAELRKIEEIQYQINLLESQEDLAEIKDEKIKFIEQEISKQDELKKAYHVLNESRRKDLSLLKEGTPEWNKLKSEVESTSEAWWKSELAIKSLRKEINDLNDKEIADNIKAMEEQKKALEDNLKDVEDSINDNLDAIEKMAKKAEKKELERLKNKKETEVNYWKEKRDLRLAELEQEQEDNQKAWDLQIDAVENQIDKIKEANDAYDEQAERKKHLLALQEAENRLTFALGEKNTRLVTDNGVEYVADPREVASAQESLKTVQENYRKFELDTQRNHQIKKLEEQKKALETSKKLDDDNYKAQLESEKIFYEQQIKNTEEFWNTKIETTEDNYEALYELLEDRENVNYEALKLAGEKITSLEQDGFTTRLSQAQSFVNEYNAIMSMLQDMSSTGTSSSVSSIGSSVAKQSSSKNTASGRGGLFSSSNSISKVTTPTGGIFGKMRSYDVGGYIDKDQIANIHKDEVVMNPDQQSNLISNIANGNIPAIGKDMFTLSNVKPSTVSNNNKSEVISINTVKIDNVTDLPNFVMQLKRHVQTR